MRPEKVEKLVKMRVRVGNKHDLIIAADKDGN
jgi:hypothetical protein